MSIFFFTKCDGISQIFSVVIKEFSSPVPSRSLFGSGLTILVVALLVVEKKTNKKGAPLWSEATMGSSDLPGPRREKGLCHSNAGFNWKRALLSNDEVDFSAKPRTSAEF